MLTSAEISSLRLVHAGTNPPHEQELSSLIDKGLVRDNAGSYALTDAGQAHIGVLESFGDAIVDAVLPGVGSKDSQIPNK